MCRRSDQYLDPTASLLAFGSLPFSLSGKPALNIDKGTMARVPVPAARALRAGGGYAVRSLPDDGTRQARSISVRHRTGSLVIGRFSAQGLETVDRRNTARQNDRAGRAYRLLATTACRTRGSCRTIMPLRRRFRSASVSRSANASASGCFLSTDIRRSICVSKRGRRKRAGLSLAVGWNTARRVRSRSREETDCFRKARRRSRYRKSVSGQAAYGTVSGRIEVNGSAVIEGRTIRSSALVRLGFNQSSFARPNSERRSRLAGTRSTNSNTRAVGLTPKIAGPQSRTSAPTLTKASVRLRQDSTNLP